MVEASLMRRPTDLELGLQLLGVFATFFILVPAAVATVRPYWLWDRRWKAFATVGVVIVLTLLVPPPPNAGDRRPVAPAVSAAPVAPQPIEVPVPPTWEYMDDPNGPGKVGRAACIGSLDDDASPDTQAEICVSRLNGENDAWLRDDDPKFTWGAKPTLELQFGSSEPEIWDSGPGNPPEVGLLAIGDPPGLLKLATRGGSLVAIVTFADSSVPRVFRFDLSGLQPAQLLRHPKPR